MIWLMGGWWLMDLARCFLMMKLKKERNTFFECSALFFSVPPIFKNGQNAVWFCLLLHYRFSP